VPAVRPTPTERNVDQRAMLTAEMSAFGVLLFQIGLERMPSRHEVLQVAERWRPHRSPAANYLVAR
jgi:3-methyladenine DNA glycosylase/8-oxoguanine DNA glycosylase